MKRSKTYPLHNNKFKSQFEYNIAVDLINRGVDFEYESRVLSYTIPVLHTICSKCGHSPAMVTRKYKPDFILPNGVIVEAKGRFTAAERKKHACLKEQRPDLDIRLLFMYDNYLTNKKNKSYTSWCDSKEIISAVGYSIPEDWISYSLSV